MICPTCYGHGFIPLQSGPRICRKCGGKGNLNCCEGEQAQCEQKPDQERTNDDSSSQPSPTPTS
jgi:hypothetical protein